MKRTKVPILVILLAMLAPGCASTDTGDPEVDARNRAKNASFQRFAAATTKGIVEARIEKMDESKQATATLLLDTTYEAALVLIDAYENDATVDGGLIAQNAMMKALTALALMYAESG